MAVSAQSEFACVNAFRMPAWENCCAQRACVCLHPGALLGVRFLLPFRITAAALIRNCFLRSGA